jgi:hypothetical protein
MGANIPPNELYFSVLPQISLSMPDYGRTQQVLTLLPDKAFATAFFPDEVDTYVRVFTNREKHLIGGHVTGYTVHKESTPDGRVFVKVTQNVE